MVFRSPQLLLLLVLLPIFIGLWVTSKRRLPTAALGLRLLMVTLIVTAIADPVLGTMAPSQLPVVVLVDQSGSLSPEQRAAARTIARNLSQGYGARTRIVLFGADIVGGDATPDPAGSDIGAALRSARALGAGGEVVLISDGLATTADALTAARELAIAGITVDTVSLAAAPRADIWLARIEAPVALREGEAFAATIVIGASEATSAQIAIRVSGDAAETREVALQPGENRVTYESTAGQTGVLTLEADVRGAPDAIPENNRAASTVVVGPAPNILLVEERPGNGAFLRNALRTQGANVELITAAALPTAIDQLNPYDGVVLIDLPATVLNFDQMAALREFVRSEGHGLTVTGGRSSLTLGDYAGTPLEAALPVTMEPPPRPDRGEATILMIIDRSASMGPEGGRSKFVMAKEAAMLATEALKPGDRVGVLAFDVSPEWVAPIQPIDDAAALAQLKDAIGSIPLGGGTDIYAALDAGLPALAQAPGNIRHVVLLTDGRSFSDERPAFRALIEQARASGITLSSIAIGIDSDTELLQELATWGAGRYYFAASPEDIPRLTLAESKIARAEPQVEGVFRAEQEQPHATLRDFTANELPRLAGYAATTARPEAEVVLQSPDGDPVLAAWQYGLGRAVVWAPSIEEPWAPNWASWDAYGQFWSGIVRYTLPEPDAGPLRARVVAGAAGNATLIADAVGVGGEPLDLADTQAIITLPDGTSRTLTLPQVAPGRYAQELVLAEAGAYAIEVRQAHEGALRSTRVGFARGYADEYLPRDPANGTALLAAIRTATGGSERDAAALTTAREAPVLPVDTPWLRIALLGAAALLWPIEIAVRRGVFRRR